MKILVTYYSGTGNTEKVAHSIKEGITGHDVEIFPVKEVEPTSLKNYDCVILGSGIYASRIHKSVLDLVKNAEPEIPAKFAYFCTHASLEFYQKPFIKVTKILSGQASKVIGEFDCVGESLGIPMEQRMKMLERLPEDKKEKAIADMKLQEGRPNQEDLTNAKKFGTELLNKL